MLLSPEDRTPHGGRRGRGLTDTLSRDLSWSLGGFVVHEETRNGVLTVVTRNELSYAHVCSRNRVGRGLRYGYD